MDALRPKRNRVGDVPRPPSPERAESAEEGSPARCRALRFARGRTAPWCCRGRRRSRGGRRTSRRVHASPGRGAPGAPLGGCAWGATQSSALPRPLWCGSRCTNSNDTPRPRAPREPGWIKSRDKRDLETVLTWRTQLGGFVFEPSAYLSRPILRGQAGGLGRAGPHPAARPSLPPLPRGHPLALRTGATTSPNGPRLVRLGRHRDGRFEAAPPYPGRTSAIARFWNSPPPAR